MLFEKEVVSYHCISCDYYLVQNEFGLHSSSEEFPVILLLYAL